MSTSCSRGLIGDEWHLADENDWARVEAARPSATIWNVRNQGRRELVDMVRRLTGEDVLDPGVLTIGFARRFATYKRSTLLLEPDGAPQGAAARRRPARAVRVRRQGPPGRRAGQGHDPRDRPAGPLRRRRPPVRVHPRLRHRDRPHDVPRVRRVAEHAAAADGGVRHERDEGGAERRPELLDPRRLVGRDVGGPQRLRHRLVRRRPRPRAPRSPGGRRHAFDVIEHQIVPLVLRARRRRVAARLDRPDHHELDDARLERHRRPDGP